MKKSKSLILFLIAFLFILSARSAWADFIEVKGKGVMNGSIVSETDDEMVFKDNDGFTQTFQKSDITFVERVSKEKAKPAAERKKEPQAQSSGSKSEPAASAGKGEGVIRLNIPKNPMSKYFEPGSKAPMPITLTVNEYLLQVADKFREYLYMDSIQEMTKKISEAVKKTKDFQKNYGTKNYVMGFAGMILMGVGSLMAVWFGFSMIFAAFSEGIKWGFLYLVNVFAVMQHAFGPDAALFFVVTRALTIYLIIFHWSAMRKPFVLQMFGLTIVLSGYLIFHLAA